MDHVLPRVLSAIRGQSAFQVFQLCKMYCKSEGVPIEFVEGEKVGVHLSTVKGKCNKRTFSLKYEREGEVFIIYIGERICDKEHYVRNAACQIIAMLMRGARSWEQETPQGKSVTYSGYGPVKCRKKH